MNPIKLHRTVRHGAVGSSGDSDRCIAAIESAENEGWPPAHSHGARVRLSGARHGLGEEPAVKLPLR